MNEPLRIHGRLLVKNTALNVLGHGVPLVVALAAIPVTVRGLGVERFGILAIAWMVLGYFTELGFGRATTKFVADAVARGDESRLASVAWATVVIQLAFGILGALVLLAAAPLLADRIFRIPAELSGEALASFYVLAAAVPAVVVSSAFRGVLEAAQRFDLVNAVRIPSSVANFFLPVLGLLLGFGLPGILLLLVGARLATVLAYYVLGARIFPVLRGRPRFRRTELPELVRFGGWITVSGFVSPLLVYLDRFMLGALVAVSAVAYYTAPYEVVTRLWIVPGSLFATLFPAFSTLAAQGRSDYAGELLWRGVRAVLFVLAPVVALLVVGAPTLLHLWLGPDFARASALAFQILAIGVLVNSLAFVPQALVQGFGRADLTAKFHLLELPLQLILAWALVRAWGVPGAALAWSIRVAVDAALLFGAAARVQSLALPAFAAEGSAPGDDARSGLKPESVCGSL